VADVHSAEDCSRALPTTGAWTGRTQRAAASLRGSRRAGRDIASELNLGERGHSSAAGRRRVVTLQADAKNGVLASSKTRLSVRSGPLSVSGYRRCVRLRRSRGLACGSRVATALSEEIDLNAAEGEWRLILILSW